MYTRVEIESWTGVSRRTLRFWISKGIVPGPVPSRGRSARYSDEHIRRIQQIKRDLWDNRVTIADLRDRYNPEVDT